MVIDPFVVLPDLLSYAEARLLNFELTGLLPLVPAGPQLIAPGREVARGRKCVVAEPGLAAVWSRGAGGQGAAQTLRHWMI